MPLALVVLAPITLNIFAFHAFLEPPATLIMPLVLTALHVSLAWAWRPVFAPLFATPAKAKAAESLQPATVGA